MNIKKRNLIEGNKGIIFLGIVIASILSVFILRDFLFNPGYINNVESLASYPFVSQSTAFTWNPLTQSPNRIDVTPAYFMFSLLGSRLAYFTILILMGTSIFFVTFKFAQILKTGNENLVALISTIFYFINPIISNEIFRFENMWHIAIIPLFFYINFIYLRNIEKYSNKELIKCIIIFSIILTLIVDPRWKIFSIMVIILNFFINFKYKKLYILNSFKLIILAFILHILLSSFWVIPIFNQYSSGVAIAPDYTLTLEIESALSRNANLLNAMREMGGYWLLPEQFYLTGLLQYIFLLSTVFLSIIFFIPLLIKKNNRVVMILSLFCLFLILFTTGLYYNGFGKFYSWLMFEAPLISSFGWLLRGPEKWSWFILLIHTLLLSIAVGELSNRIIKSNLNKFRKTSLLIIFSTALIFIIIFSGYPLLNFDANPLKPSIIQNDYLETNKILQEEIGIDSIFPIPEKPLWGYPVSTISLSKPARYKPLFLLVTKNLNDNKTRELGLLLGAQNVKYIILDKNKLTDTQFSAYYSLLENQLNLELYKTIGNISIFRNNLNGEKISPKNAIVVSDDLSKIISLSKLDLNIFSRYTIVFSEQNADTKELITNSKNTIISPDYFSGVHTKNNDKFLIQPFQASDNHNPSKVWSKASTTDPLHGPFHPYLEQLGIENWDFDYSKGLVFTWAYIHIPENLRLSDTDLTKSWDFSSEFDLDDWKDNTPKSQFGATQDTDIEYGTLKTTLKNSTWGWKTLRSSLIEASNKNTYRIAFNIRGQNSHKGHVKLIEYDFNKKVITNTYIQSVNDGTFDWQQVEFDYTPQNESTQYLQLQIWHGHLTDKTLPNTIWIDNVKVYDVTKYREPTTLDVPFKVEKSGKYKLSMRYFENEKGGLMKVRLGNVTFSIDSENQLNKFVWKDLGTLNFAKGDYKLILENHEGLNAVNIFALIPEEEYIKLQEEVENLVQNKTVIYVFEAESDLYRNNAEKDTDFGADASNGETIKFSGNGLVWKDLDIIKEGTYRIALKGQGRFTLKVDDKQFQMRSDTLNFLYTPLIQLTKGPHKIEISAPNNSYLDVVWMYSTDSMINLDDLFRVDNSPAEINYTKIDPTKYKVHINANEPFMLAFAESYDPLWKAYTNDGLEVKSIPLYSVINGFWIDKTGEYDLTIEYEPQKWFYIGSAISIITFLACLFYLLYDWRFRNVIKKTKV